MCMYKHECMYSSNIYIKIIERLFVFSLYLSLPTQYYGLRQDFLEQKNRKHVHPLSQTSVSLSLYPAPSNTNHPWNAIHIRHSKASQQYE